ncbi:MAG: universal stress protein [Actinobacteria bacterium]|nr:MAG: universal stress protein [Actinomycetota bacterium]
MLTVRRQQHREDLPPVPAESRPIMLATLAVDFDPLAAEFAVDAAVEAGQPLIVVNVVQLEFMPSCIMLGYDEMTEHPELVEALRAPAELAHALGVQVERLRVRSPHPLDALVELVAERGPGLLVFGPDRARLKPRTYRKAAQKIRDRVACLVWLPE